MSELTTIQYRHTTLYYALLYCTLQIRRCSFYKLKISCKTCAKQVYWHHFSNGICSLHVSVSHLGNSCHILVILVFQTLHQQNHYDSLKAQEMICLF